VEYVEKHFRKEEIKVLIGDNLRAHLSPTVLSTCERHNIRFVFLPENSTHIMQPLDVSVFGPMKKRWRTILNDWKEECTANGHNYASIPKQDFPGLLKKLLEKDFGPAIRGGFEGTGLCPFSVERAISKLPMDLDDREVETQVESTLLRTLDNMRHNAPANRAAARPKKSDKLPAGAAYTCAPQDDNNDSSSTSSESDDEEIAGIVDRLPEQSDEEEEEVEEDLISGGGDELPDLYVRKNLTAYVVAIYEGEWFLAEICKDQQNVAAGYTRLSYMSIKGNNSFTWPEKEDIHVALDEDIIIEPVLPELLNNRGYLGLKKKDVDKVSYLMVVVYSQFTSLLHFSFLQNTGVGFNTFYV